MAKHSMTARELVGKILEEGNGDLLKDAMIAVLEQLMGLEVAQVVGAERYSRNEERQNHRNGYRERRWDTRVGTLDLKIPKLRHGSYFPSFLDPRRRAEQALCNVVLESYVHGVSTRKVEDLVRALGVESLSKSEVSRIGQSLDEQVEIFRTRPLEMAYPYVWLDAKYEKVRENGRVVSNALVVAYAVNEGGYREVIGVAAGGSENEAFWTEFLRGLVARGLHGVKLVISDCHEGLKSAIQTVFTGAAWQRCMVHFLRNVQGRVSKSSQGMVTAAVKTIFTQPDYATAKEQLRRIADMLRPKHPEVADMLERAEEDVLAYMTFPEAYWRQIRSTNSLERLNKEIARRTDVVGIFPNRAALIRLVAMVLAEQNDEWMVGKRYMSLESLTQLKGSAQVIAPTELLPGTGVLEAA